MLNKTFHKIKRRPLLSVIIAIIVIYVVRLLFAVSPFLSLTTHPFRLTAGEKNYLVLFQNNYELRPTGGFISAFGILTFRHGIPVSFNFEDVYGTVDDHPRITPPYPLSKLLAHTSYPGHTFRDANVDPDFPASAAELEKFLHLTRPFQKIDGVFAIDLTFFENWMKSVSSVSVNGIKFDPSNMMDQIENLVRNVDFHSETALADRKSGAKDLIKKMVLKSILPWNTPGFIDALAQSFDEKHAITFFKDDILESIIKDKDWGGDLAPASGEDFLGVVDANYGSGKSNRYVKRSVFYNIDLESGKSSLNIHYDNPANYNVPLSTDYKGYVRAYVPADHKVSNAELVGLENGLAYAGQTFVVPVTSSGDVRFNFNFPKSTLDELTYNLNLWKQPGVFGDYYEVTVRVPNGMRMQSSDFDVAENIATYRGFLTQDKKLSFVLEKDITPPRALSQDLKSLNLLQIDWTEPINPDSLHPEAWSIKDGDIKNSTKDDISIESASSDGVHLYIKTKGMTVQPEERYILEISGVEDYHNNATTGKQYTFVQRLE